MNHAALDAQRTMLRRVRLVETDDSGGLQTMRVTGLRGEELKGVPRLQHYGLSASPPAGATGILAALGGQSDRAMLIGVESDAKRPRDLPAGGVALYGPDGQILKYVDNNVTWDATGTMTIKTTGEVTIESAAAVTVKVGGTTVKIADGRIDLGAAPAPHRVMTEAGPSDTVWAVL